MIARASLVIAGIAGLALAASAAAAPVPAPGMEHLVKGAPPGTPSFAPGALESSGFFDNFNSYTVGSGVVGQNGWQFWSPGYPDGIVTSFTAASPPNSLEAVYETDIVQVFNITEGVWEAKVDTFVPTGMTGDGFFIMLNTFSAPYVSGGSWSLQIRFMGASGLVQSEWGYETIPLIYDQWVELRAEIDLDTQPDGVLNVWYGGQQFVFNRPWVGNTSLTGERRIQCIDLFSLANQFGPPNMGFRWDNVSLQPLTSGCYADCDQNSALNVDDFICFINAFATQDPYADCDQNATLNVDDFICFINAFALGCP
jgi:hypothetical protein